jgi:predicted transposase YbfD/YdcC
VQQVFRITRECTRADRETGELRRSSEVVYGITDLSREQANAARLLHLNRSHWRIENSVFHVRDEVFGEDRCRVRRKSDPEVFAGLRNAALSLLRLSGRRHIYASLRSCTWNLLHIRKILAIV